MDSPLTDAQNPAGVAPGAVGPTLSDTAKKAGDTMVADAEKRGIKIEKLVIAIHGIGDQYHQATIQSVVERFGGYFNHPGTVPLGSFYAEHGHQITAFTLKAPPKTPQDLAAIGFVEAYWANIPRRVQREGYIIQESKAWARTIVERIRARYGDAAEETYQLKHKDFVSASMVIDEMVDTIAVLGNLLFLAEKAGVLQFDLDNLLTAYLGDVQIVADFANYRAEILERFNDVLDPVFKAIKKRHPAPEIYIVAHSEGTVIAFMALLQAMCAPTPGEKHPPKRPAWIDHVHGFMTIGSPIDKHIVLWPGIWDPVKTPGQAPACGPIKWRNYYDYGDPVGFELDTTRAWLRHPAHDWESLKAFEFRDAVKGVPQDDFGFGRYFLPGEAHNEYWNDPDVFGHFIETVVCVPPGAECKGDFSKPPQSRLWAQIISYVLPYGLTAATLYAGVYILFVSLRGFLTNDTPRTACEDCLLVNWLRGGCTPSQEPLNSVFDVILNVMGITSLMTAMTLGARIPRLTRSWGWQLGAVVLFAGFASLYVFLVDAPRRCWLGFHAVKGILEPGEEFVPTLCTLGLATGSTLFAIWVGRQSTWRGLQKTFRGIRPLLLIGVATMTFIIAFRLTHPVKGDETPRNAAVGERQADKKADSPPIWPLLLGGAAFTYLWWLAALLFDLVFVWHRYIRHATLQARLHELVDWREEHDTPSGDAPAATPPAATG